MADVASCQLGGSGRRECHRSAFAALFLLVWLALGSASSGQDLTQSDATESLAALSFGFDSEWSTRYTWHGLEFSDGAVSQNCAWIELSGLTASVWTNYSLVTSETPRFDEIDLSISYERSLGIFTIEPAVQTYLYPDQAGSPSTSEISVKIGVKYGVLSPFYIHTSDVNEYWGSSFEELGLSVNTGVSERVAIEAHLEFGYGSPTFRETYAGATTGDFTLVVLRLGFSWQVGDFVNVKPYVNVSSILGDGMRRQIDKPTTSSAGILVGLEL